jgi:hypothetical protein
VPDRLVLIFLIDALGYTQAGKNTILPFLEVPRAPIRSVLGYSSAAIPTIMTGLPPERHGHFSMYRRASGDGVFRSVRPVIAVASRMRKRSWRVRRFITSYLRRRGITGYFSLYDIPLEQLGYFDLCQRRDLYSPGAFGGGIEGLADLMARDGLSRVWNWSVPEDRAFAELESEAERGERAVLFLYASVLDTVMHAAGPDSEQTRNCLQRYHERIERVLARARGRYREVRVLVFGDHGMAPVREAHDLWASLEALDLRAPQDYLYFLDSTMARFWFRNERSRRKVEQCLEGLTFGRVLPPEELRRLGTYFPDGSYGELIFVLNEGEILVPSYMGRERVLGMHGYHPDAAHSFTTLATNIADRPYPDDLMALHRFLRGEITEALR